MMFSSTVISAKIPGCCGPYATPRSTIRWGGVPVISTPSRSTCPLVGLRKPKIAFRSVDFPTPFAPRMAVTRPGRATTLTPRRMWRSR